MNQPAVYSVTNQRNGTLYVGVISNVVKRIYEHKEGAVKDFNKKYGCKILLFYELHETMISTISREKQIKAGFRKKKLMLIESINLNWRVLYEDIFC